VAMKAMTVVTAEILHHQYLSPYRKAMRVAGRAPTVTRQPTVTAMNNRKEKIG
jgi:hypothetical protein